MAQETVTPTDETEMKAKKPESVKLAFWLACTAEIQSIDYTNERTSVKLFTKWWFKSPEFFDKNVLKKLVLFDASNDERLDDLLKGQRVDGCRIDGTAGSHFFPVNPEAMILNATQERCGPDWVKLFPKTEVVCCQLVFTADLRTPFDMKEYPFDRHIIPMSLGTRKWKENKVKHLWSILPSMPDWVDEPYPEDKCIINENVAWIDPHAEIGHLPPVVHIKEDGKPVLCIRVQRDPSYFIYTVSIPICAIVLLCLSSFFLSFNNATDRLNAVLVSTLALAAYKNSVEVNL
jgi:hypothetical protein